MPGGDVVADAPGHPPAPPTPVPRTALTAHLARAGLPVVELDPPRRRTVVVVPHPDDESLATGGLIARQTTRGVEVIVVAVTDGEAAFPDRPVADLASIRRDEQRRAVGLLGPDVGRLIRFRLPDGRLATCERVLVRRLTALVRPGDLVIAPWCHDRHPDHEACGRAAAVAAGTHGNELWESLFWAHQHGGPTPVHRGLGVLHLTPSEHGRRQAAIEAHASQLGGGERPAVVAPADRAHLDHPSEVYLVATGPAGP